MFKKLIIKLLYRIYVGSLRGITKMDQVSEYKAYLLQDPSLVETLIKTRLSRLTLKYFEAKSDIERAQIKGAALELKAIKDNCALASKLSGIHNRHLDAARKFAKHKFI